jgi:GTPase SAR1 family protein
VFDVNRRESFEKCSFWLNQIKGSDTLDHTPVLMLIGNKIDQPNREVRHDEAVRFAEENNMIYNEISAKKNIDVFKCYRQLIRKIYTSCDLDNIDEKHGIRKGMVYHSDVKIKEDWCCCCIN